MSDNHKYNPVGYARLLSEVVDRLITRKKVALWEDYRSAVQDLLMEYKNSQTAETYAALEDIFRSFEEQTYLEEWYKEL